jgi:hypothetical protein
MKIRGVNCFTRRMTAPVWHKRLIRGMNVAAQKLVRVEVLVLRRSNAKTFGGLKMTKQKQSGELS